MITDSIQAVQAIVRAYKDGDTSEFVHIHRTVLKLTKEQVRTGRIDNEKQRLQAILGRLRAVLGVDNLPAWLQIHASKKFWLLVVKKDLLTSEEVALLESVVPKDKEGDYMLGFIN